MRGWVSSSYYQQILLISGYVVATQDAQNTCFTDADYFYTLMIIEMLIEEILPNIKDWTSMACNLGCCLSNPSSSLKRQHYKATSAPNLVLKTFYNILASTEILIVPQQNSPHPHQQLKKFNSAENNQSINQSIIMNQYLHNNGQELWVDCAETWVVSTSTDFHTLEAFLLKSNQSKPILYPVVAKKSSLCQNWFDKGKFVIFCNPDIVKSLSPF